MRAMCATARPSRTRDSGRRTRPCRSIRREGCLAIDDDIDLREAIRALRLARLDDPVVSDPELAVKRNEAQARLEAIVAARPGRRDALPRGEPAGSSRARALRLRDPGARGAPVRHRLQSDARDRPRPHERRAEVQPRARIPARPRHPAERGGGRHEPEPGRQRLEGRRGGRARKRVLTSVAARAVGSALALGVLLPLVVLLFFRQRARKIRRHGLALVEPRGAGIRRHRRRARRHRGARRGCRSAARLEQTRTLRERTDAEAFVVLDVSRSMLAQQDTGSATPHRPSEGVREDDPLVAAGDPVRSRVDHRPDAPAPLPERRSRGLRRDARSLARHRAASAALLARAALDQSRSARDDPQPALLRAEGAQAPPRRAHGRRVAAGLGRAACAALRQAAGDARRVRPRLGAPTSASSPRERRSRSTAPTSPRGWSWTGSQRRSPATRSRSTRSEQ